jgi:hypothetical protein
MITGQGGIKQPSILPSILERNIFLFITETQKSANFSSRFRTQLRGKLGNPSTTPRPEIAWQQLSALNAERRSRQQLSRWQNNIISEFLQLGDHQIFNHQCLLPSGVDLETRWLGTQPATQQKPSPPMQI